MGGMQMFFRRDTAPEPNLKVKVTKALTDDNGEPLEWEFKRLTIREDEEIRKSCTRRVQIPGKHGLTIPELDGNLYAAKVIAASCVHPNLKDAELQNSYGVYDPEELLKEMVSCVGEYTALTLAVQRLNGMDVSLGEEMQEAKN